VNVYLTENRDFFPVDIILMQHVQDYCTS